MGVKEYELPNGRKAVFEFDENGVGKITLEAMDMLMELIEERKEGEWINDTNYSGWTCTNCGYHDGNAVDNYKRKARRNSNPIKQLNRGNTANN